MKTLRFGLIALGLLVAMSLVGWLPKAEPAIAAYAQDEGGLNSVLVTDAPVLDGIADEAAWATAPVTEVDTRKGENDSDTTLMLQSVYTDDMVYFLIRWEDPTQSFLRSPWEMQPDGTWIQLADPEDKGGDNNVWYEDKLALIWPINNSIPDFEFDGCFTACHRSSAGDPKPYGNKYTDNEGEMGDIWHWKSIRNLNQLDDQYLDSTNYSTDTPEAGRHSDPKESGGYNNNINDDKTAPAFMPAGDFPHDGSPGFILETEAVPFDPTLFKAGDRLPAIVISTITGDRGDISAGWKWEDGMWTLEFARKLVTGSEFDVQFDDLSATYYFGIADFDNVQVRHAFGRDPVAFRFQQ